MSDEDLALSEESKDLLQTHVRKGKACKFFLLSRGSTVVALGVFRKGAFGTRIQAARKNGLKGEITCGLVTGAGNKLFFQLAGNGAVADAMKVDDWSDSPPVSAAKLREFLKERELAVQPSFHVITDVATAVDPDRESDAPLPPPPPGSEVSDEPSKPEAPKSESGSPPPPPPPPPKSQQTDSREAEFARRLKALRPDLDRVLAANVSASREAKLRASECGALGRQKDFAAACSVLDQLEEIVQEGLRQISDGGKQTEGDAPGKKSELSPVEFKRRLETLIERIKQAGGSEAARTARLKASEAGVFARKGDLTKAFELLAEAEDVFPEGETSADEKRWAEFEREWSAVRDGVELAMRIATADPKTADELSDWCERGDRALEERRDLEAAERCLDSLAKRLAEPPPEDEVESEEETSQESEVGGEPNAEEPADEDEAAEEFAAALERWKSARSKAVDQLTQLERALSGSGDAEANQAIILVKAIRANLTAAPETARQVDELMRYLETDSIVDEAEQRNGFGIRVRLRRPLLAALRELKSRIPA